LLTTEGGYVNCLHNWGFGFALLRLISTDSVSVDLVTYRADTSDKSTGSLTRPVQTFRLSAPNTLTSTSEGLARPLVNTGSRYDTASVPDVYLLRRASSSPIPTLRGGSQRFTTEGSYRDYRYAFIVVW